MDKKIIISYIIPAYNAEKTIEKAISSILVSDRVEVIVVENGSTDNTYNKVHQLQEKNPSIKLLQSDKGVSCARNKGMEHAEGNWIAFVDADDYLFDNGVRTMLLDAEVANNDLVVYGHKAGNRVNKVTKRDVLYHKKTHNDCRVKMISNPTKYMQVWGKLFKKKVIVENAIKFDPELRLSEDSDFTLQYMKYVNNIKLSSEVIYNYSLDVTSTMRVNDGGKTRDYMYAMNKSAIHVDDESEDIKKAFDKYVLMHINILMVREIFIGNEKFVDKIETMKRICKENIFLNPIKRVRINECKSFRMMPFVFMKMKQNWLAGMIYMIRVKHNNKMEVNR